MQIVIYIYFKFESKRKDTSSVVPRSFQYFFEHIYCDNINRLNEYKQQTTNNLQLYSCARSQHAIRVNWLNIITPPSLISAYPSSPFNRVFI